MKVHADAYDSSTAYADLDPGELLTEAQQARALKRGRELGVRRVEVWRGIERIKVLTIEGARG